jgi:hypothetical protein
MGGVSVWLGLLVNLVTVVGALAGWGAWIIRSLDRRFDLRMEARIGALETHQTQRADGLDRRLGGLETKLTGRIDVVETKLTDRIDVVETKLTDRIDGLREVTDVRLRALESDMTIIKQHLLGTTSAA